MPLPRVLTLALAFLALLAAPAGRAAEPAAAPSRDYQLQPGDLIRVQVFQEAELDREVKISQDGEISLPLIGRVVAKGVTVGRLEETVRELYDRDYLVNPQITITVLKYQSRVVNVLGAVNAPQAIEFPPEQSLTILDAISRAGGFSRLADRKRVKLTRTGPDGRVENFVINADDIISGGAAEKWTVQKDDLIFVPERVL